MVVIVWTVVRIVMVPIVSVARRISICARTAIVYIVNVILWVRAHCSATARASVNVNQVSLATNVIVVKPISINLVPMAVSHVAAIKEVPLKMCLLVIQHRAYATARIMWRASVVMSKFFVIYKPN